MILLNYYDVFLEKSKRVEKQIEKMKNDGMSENHLEQFHKDLKSIKNAIKKMENVKK